MNPSKRSGLVLIMVLVLIAIMAATGFGLAERMLLHRRAMARLGRRMQARELAASGVAVARELLDRDRTAQDQAGGWYNNPSKFDGVLVIDDEVPSDRGRFAVVAPLVEDRMVRGIRYGLEDESARINLRTILKMDEIADNGARKALLALPGMDESTADAILDWIDEDDEVRPLGAEVEYYTSQQPAYAPRNAPPATVEELLLVRGVTPQLLFGLDAPRMAADADAATLLAEPPPGVQYADGTMDHGWAAYFTLYSGESNVRADGTLKINLNDDDLERLYDELEKSLGEQWATFIVAYRQNGSKGKSTRGQKTANPQGKLDLKKKATVTIRSILDLVGVRTSAKFKGSDENTSLDSPCSEDNADLRKHLPELLDNTTLNDASVMPGRININQAPRIVLSAIPLLGSDAVEQIIAKRSVDPLQADPQHRYATWILTEGIVPLETMKTLLPILSTQGSVYRANAYGFFDQRGPTAHLEVLLDAGQRPSSVLFWRDVSHLGIGYEPHNTASHTR